MIPQTGQNKGKNCCAKITKAKRLRIWDLTRLGKAPSAKETSMVERRINLNSSASIVEIRVALFGNVLSPKIYWRNKICDLRSRKICRLPLDNIRKKLCYDG
ncbi:hypothetical protein ACH5RR_001249 [Cinchona calisaya]|uniref:Uncharacterized protein n=1 Tax=Cinchona calisaya TaxID=153742 RepID=A0ABD3B3I3_9GENT